MQPAQFARLVENFKTDGRMTGVVTVCLDQDGALEILSGHHRVMAAIEAGFETVEAVTITTPLSEERKVAIQLSHNSISGEDNASILAQMYEGLELDAKKFSGLTDDVLGALSNLTGVSLGTMQTQYEELRISFLPEARAELEAQIDTIKKNKKTQTWAARFEDFNAVFDAIVRVKHALAIVNNALAISMMAQLACERLDQIKEENAGEEAAKPDKN